MRLPPAIAVVSLLLLRGTWASGQNTATNAHYTLSFSRENMRTVHVEATFTVGDSVLYMISGMDHLPDGWRTFVRNERLVNAAGASIPLRRGERHRWTMRAERGTAARLSYDVLIQHDTPPINWFPGPREAAYARDWGVFALGRALFVVPDLAMTNTRVDITMPREWRVASALPMVATDPTQRVAVTRRELTDALFFVGQYLDLSLKQGPLSFDFAVAPSYASSLPLFARVASNALSTFRDVFARDPAKPQYLVVVNPETAQTDGFGGAFRSGFSMTFPFVPSEQNIGIWAFTLTHETFHLWNAYTISRASEAEEWFLEGGADYYTVRALGKAGVYSRAMALGMHGRSFALYNRIAGRVSPAAAGASESKSGDMLYKGGWTLLAALDLDIRARTRDAKSLDDVMRLLASRLSSSAAGYTNRDLVAALNEVSGADYTDFFVRFITGVERLELAPYLDAVGLVLEGGVLREKPNATELEKARLKAWIGS